LLLGMVGPWPIAYVLGNLLGPIHLFGTITIALLLIAATIVLAIYPPRIEWKMPSPGQRLALLAVALLAISMVPLQLASPAVAFALVGLALGFFLESRRSRTLLAAGAILLGTSVASHAIDGGFAMIVAGMGVVMWGVSGDFRRFFAGVIALAGATLIALPEFAIGLNRPLPYPLVPLMLLAGVAIACAGALVLDQGEAPELARLSDISILLAALFIG